MMEKRRNTNYREVECPICRARSPKYCKLVKIKKNWPFGRKSRPIISERRCKSCGNRIEPILR